MTTTILGVGVTTSNYTFRIGDNATVGAGSYEILLCCSCLPTWQFAMMTDLSSAGNTNMGFQAGQNDCVWNTEGGQIAEGTEEEELLQAINYWSQNNSLLYLTVMNSVGTNRAKMITSTADMTLIQQRVRLLQFRIAEVQASGFKPWFQLKKYTT